MDRQLRERICTDQINDDEVPTVRSTHGVISLHEAHVHEGGCRVDPVAGNREADHLANGEYSRFSHQNVDLAQMQWDVLPDVLSLGKAAEDDVSRLKESGQCLQRNLKRRKRKPDERLRLKDPW